MEKDCQLKSSSIACFLVSFGCIFAWGIGSIHLFDLDELYFAEITREMMRTGSYGQVTFNFEPLYEKPPLFFWLQAASMHLWGINEVGARFPNLLCGLLTLATLYYIGQQYKGRWFGFLWMCLYATAFLPHFYFKSGIIDPFFNYFLLTAIYFLSRAATPSKEWLYGCAGLSIGFALLAKGPMGFIIPLATLSLAYTWFKGSVVRLKGLILALLVATAVLSCWLIPEIWSNGCRFIKEFWDYHLLLYHQPVATHVQPWYYHYLVLFFGCFPSSLFAICFLQEKRLIRPLSKSICDQQFLGEAQSSTAAYSDVCEEHRQASTPKLPLEIEFRKRAIQGNYFAANMQALWAVVLLIFTLVGTKIVHYSSMAYFPITFFAAGFFHQRMYSLRIGGVFLTIGLVLGSVLTIMPWVMNHKAVWVPLIKNQTIKDALELPLVWNHWDSIPGVIYMIGIVLAYYYLVRLRLVPFIGTFMSINICVLALFLRYIAPKVEAYTQKEMVDFCKACKGKDLYLRTIGFKSAAPLFYADQPKGLTQPDITWLLEGAIDKPCFFILYKSDRASLEHYKDITYLKSAGCFAFYKRLPKRSMQPYDTPVPK
ncbi:MAG: glycosyltransferase family 39 protein [Candidatus Cardinium sp.]|uniref:glycosyltransferase family 39 protein n=1 Tax=Cardinium endosymbiont of Dermatophagoides farinae TaxID=2597823 RepID=UPI001183800F|nr:glycosyltransferase family 39 protein [Cardinium endosymbiont of Dermatophagoides farinae]TSJ80772.1 palindromic element RPE1 domain-containing protein [Cardinium endosymbiont of Dermatophagoides farinae]UWW96776.1 MAG: glycosyltransferase family 39 protein [Candidatus Cardinium sp.]